MGCVQPASLSGPLRSSGGPGSSALAAAVPVSSSPAACRPPLNGRRWLGRGGVCSCSHALTPLEHHVRHCGWRWSEQRGSFAGWARPDTELWVCWMLPMQRLVLLMDKNVEC